MKWRFSVKQFLTILGAFAGQSSGAKGALAFRSCHNGADIAEPRVPRAIYVATFVINLLGLALPLTILQVYDRVIPNHAKETLAFLFVGLIVALALDFALKNVRAALLSWLSSNLVVQVSDEVVRRLLKAPAGSVEQESQAVHINRYGSVSALGDFHAGQSRLTAIDLPFVAVGLSVMMFVGGVMVFIPIALFFVFAALSVRRNREFRDVIAKRSLQDNKKYDFVNEVLGGILSVKAMAMEPQMQRRFERLQQSVSEVTVSSIVVGQAAQTSAILYGSISQIIVVSIGALAVIDDRLSMGALACCTMLSGQVLQPLLRTISLWMEQETVNHRRNEVRELLKWPVEGPKPSQGAGQKADIVCEQVTFYRKNATSPIFTNVTLACAAGTIVTLQGEDGSGRSTLLNILRGELAPSSGQILIGGIATTSANFSAIKPSISYVGASPSIFRGTILENLTLFRPELSRRAHQVSKDLGLDRAINLLPEGFETKLGEGIADDLPASIAQQVCIARALVSDPAILILDEANTVLDRGAEANLVRAIEQLRGQKTIIIATHRPSLLAMGDMRLRLSKSGMEIEDMRLVRVRASEVAPRAERGAA